jgi:hypothetical protein
MPPKVQLSEKQNEPCPICTKYKKAAKGIALAAFPILASYTFYLSVPCDIDAEEAAETIIRRQQFPLEKLAPLW